MATKTLEELQLIHSDMLAQANDLGVTVPDDLALEFETAEVGKATCNSLDKLLKEYRASHAASEGESPPADVPKAKRSRAKKPADNKEEKKVKTAKKAPAKKAAKKTAKKAVVAKKAAKVNGAGDARGRRATYPETAKITIVDEAAVVLLIKKGSKWSERLKKIHAAKGKKMADFSGSISDLTSAVKKGLVRVA